MTPTPRFTTVLVNVVPQGDYFIATSRDVPGLHIWAPSEAALQERVVEAIKILYKANKGIDVMVGAISEPGEFPEPPSTPSMYGVAIAA